MSQTEPATNGATAAPSSNKPLRRNGTQSSCEPCRISKLRCDHNTPCSRCVRQGRNCVYHPSPMTRRNTGGMTVESAEDTMSPEGTSPATSTSAKRHKSASSQSNSNQRKKSVPSVASGLFNPGIPFSYEELGPKFELGYTGSIAASAIFLEQEARDGQDVRPLDDVQDTVSAASLTARRQYYLSILATLPNQETSSEITNVWLLPKRSPHIRNVLKLQSNFHDSFWATFGEDLQFPRRAENLSKIADLLCRNTTKPQGIPESTRAWFASTSGENSRWEMIGLLFIRYAMYAQTVLYPANCVSDFLHDNTPSGRRKVAVTMFSCAEACLNISESLDTKSNILVVFLRERCFTFQSVLSGDTSFDLWRKGGALVNSATALGLHKDLNSTQPVSLLYVENRKHIFWVLWGVLTNIATFAGRPNPLSWRFISLTPPLDVEEEDLLEDDSAHVASLLDENGWHKSGRQCENTMRRVYSLLNIIRAELIELSLGIPVDDLSSRLANLRTKVHSIINSLPVIFRRPFSQDRMAAQSTDNADHASFYLAKSRLLPCQLLFLIERTAHPGASLSGSSLAPAREILTIVIALWLDRDSLIASHGRDHLHWFIAAFGIPAASAIAMELYRASRGPIDAPTGTSPSSKEFSETVQQLSLFVAALAWIRPEDGNYALCTRARAFIRRILDGALDDGVGAASTPPLVTAPSSASATSPFVPAPAQAHTISSSSTTQTNKSQLPNSSSIFSQNPTRASASASTAAPLDMPLPFLDSELEGWLQSAEWLDMPLGFDDSGIGGAGAGFDEAFAGLGTQRPFAGAAGNVNRSGNRNNEVNGMSNVNGNSNDSGNDNSNSATLMYPEIVGAISG